MRRVTPFLGLVLAGWILSWSAVGLWQHDLLVALSPRAGEGTRLTYLGLLYCALAAATWLCWRRMGPRLWGWGRPSLLVLGLGVGLVSALVHRGVLWLGGWWTWPAGVTGTSALLALATSLALALVEEAVFRGYLMGVVWEDRGRTTALVGVSLFFALVHLFRPGGLLFKLAYGFGLFLSSLILGRVAERTASLWPCVGVHAAWIAVSVVDPPGRVRPGWLPGLEGDPAAGLVGWVLLGGLVTLIPHLFPAPEEEASQSKPSAFSTS